MGEATEVRLSTPLLLIMCMLVESNANGKLGVNRIDIFVTQSRMILQLAE